MRQLTNQYGRTHSGQFVIAVAQRTPQCRDRRTTSTAKKEPVATRKPVYRLEEAKVFPHGLLLCEPPIGGGHLVATPPLPQCRKAMRPPIEDIKIRLLARRHSTHKGDLLAMQRIETTRCSHPNWPFTTTLFPDQNVQGALEATETELLKDAIAATGGDPNRRPSTFPSGKQQFHREANSNVWMTKNEMRYATSYFRHQGPVFELRL